MYRALSLNTPVVLFDEPTSALDADSEREVIVGLRELADRGHIVIVASHRPAVLASADAVVEVGR
jgi:ATP-binding cassette subfamily C protein CydD